MSETATRERGEIVTVSGPALHAAMAVASSRILGFPHEIVNVNGSGCSLGHPVAATGARMVATTIFELRRRGGGLGCVSMCAGGGMGSATVLEVLPAS